MFCELTRTLTEDPREAKVTEFDHSTSRDEDIFRFHITMNAVVHVTKFDGPESLPYDALCLWFGDTEEGKE